MAIDCQSTVDFSGLSEKRRIEQIQLEQKELIEKFDKSLIANMIDCWKLTFTLPSFLLLVKAGQCGGHGSLNFTMNCANECIEWIISVIKRQLTLQQHRF